MTLRWKRSGVPPSTERGSGGGRGLGVGGWGGVGGEIDGWVREGRAERGRKGRRGGRGEDEGTSTRADEYAGRAHLFWNKMSCVSNLVPS